MARSTALAFTVDRRIGGLEITAQVIGPQEIVVDRRIGGLENRTPRLLLPPRMKKVDRRIGGLEILYQERRSGPRC